MSTRNLKPVSNTVAESILLLLSIGSFLMVTLHLGLSPDQTSPYISWFPFLNLLAFLLLGFRIFQNWKNRGLHIRWYASQTVLMILMLLGLISEFFFNRILSSISITNFTDASEFIYYAIFILLFFEEISNRLFLIRKSAVNAALILMVSFAFIIVLGSFFLMLPSATVLPITYMDALFTSTSAVCVTGLVTLDLATQFTNFGQIIILLLIQIGGLGILTFTNLAGLVIMGSTSFQNQMLIQNMLNVENLADALKSLVRIVVITLLVELLGAILIFFFVKPEIFDTAGQRFYFSIFHSISAFCNAGFSTFGFAGLYDIRVRFEYDVHLVIAFLIILGGIGFGIMLNFIQYFKDLGTRFYCKFINHTAYRFKPQIITLNTRLVVYTTLILLAAGTFFYFIFEYNNTLTEHTSLWGKMVQSFFGSVTPRTAGFNTADIGKLTIPTLMIYLLLMWIGGSPGSTAGGIKTSVFAIATMNIFNQVLGKERQELGRKEISGTSIHKALAIISLSLIVIGLAVTLLVLFDGTKFDLLKIAFEVFSAFGTVGLSMGITPFLEDSSKLVLILTMFAGRVGALTILIGIIKIFVREKEKRYRYPTEEIFIT